MHTSARPLLPPSRAELRADQRRDFAQAILLRARGGADSGGALTGAQMRGENQRVQSILKASIPALSTGDSDALTLFQSGASAWLESLSNSGAFDAALADMRPLPMFIAGAIVTDAFAAALAEEGAAKKVGRLTIDAIARLRPSKAAALTVASQELLRQPGARELLDGELRRAVAFATDAIFLAALIDATTPIPSTGDSTQDLAALLAAVSTTAGSRLYLALDPDVVKALATQRSNGTLLWPGLGLGGGPMGPVTVVVSDALADGATAVLFDATQIGANGGTVEIDASSQADIVMDDAPSMASTAGSPPAPVPASVVSMFQTGGTAIRCERIFGFQVMRATSVASLEGISYTGGSP